MDEVDRDNEQFNQGVNHTVELLSSTIGSEGWVAGDGSEDYDEDLAQTLLNILKARGLYDDYNGEFARIPAWQPIDTAPRDGTHILVYREFVGIRTTNMTNPPAVAHWFDDPERPGFYTSVNEIAPERPLEATHWMPLPDRPRTHAS